MNTVNYRRPLLALAALFVAACACQRAGCAGASLPELDLQQRIDKAIAEHQEKLVLPEGRFRVANNPVFIRHASGLTIEGPKTVLVFSEMQRPALAVDDASERVTLRGFTVDYDPLPFTQGTVTGRSPDGKGYEVEIHKGYPDLAGPLLSRRLYVFDGKDRLWKRGAPDIYARSLEVTNGGRGARVSLSDALVREGFELQTGDLVTFDHRGSAAIKLLGGSADTRVEDVTIWTGPGGGIMARMVAGDGNYFRLKIDRGPRPEGADQDRLLSTTADAFNYAFARKGPILEKCEFAFMGDDSINIHGAVYPIVKVESARTVLVARRPGWDPIEQMFRAGDAAQILKADSFEPQQELQLWAWSRLYRQSDGDALPEMTPEQMREFYPSSGAAIDPASLEFLRISFSEDTSAKVGDWLDFNTLHGSGFQILDSYFHDHRAIGMRIQASDGKILRNRVERINDAAIQIGPEYGYWREAGWVRDLLVEDNTIRDVGRGPRLSSGKSVAPGAIGISARQDHPERKNPYPQGNRRITLRGNTIDGCPVAGILVNAASDVTIANNTIRNVNRGADKGASAGADHHVRGDEPITVLAAAGIRR
jgi:parallel beta-helix repeat protein